MSGTTWGKFFWSDWRSDPGLRACGYAARGLWMDMLCITAEAGGYLMVGEKKVDAILLARMTGGEIEEVKTLLAELAENDVYSVDRRGVIYSRRQINDGKRAIKNRDNGKKGGNPNLRNDLTKSGSVKPQSPESRIQVEEESTLALSGGVGVKPVSDWPKYHADQFWAAVPRRVDKIDALKALAKVRATGIAWTVFFAAVGRWREESKGKESKFIKHPATWLNKGGFHDEPAASTGNPNVQRSDPSRGPPADAILAAAHRRMGARGDDRSARRAGDGRPVSPPDRLEDARRDEAGGDGPFLDLRVDP